jgi:hypothetical protein
MNEKHKKNQKIEKYKLKNLKKFKILIYDEE